MLQLREYQEEAKKLVREEWEKGVRRVLLQLPTGVGKTVIFTSMIADYLAEKAECNPMLIVVHRNELIDQAIEKLEFCGLTDSDYGIIKSGRQFMPGRIVYVASLQTLVRRELSVLFPIKPEFIVFDEAHHCTANSYVKLFNFFQGCNVLGVTATPERSDGVGLEGCFDKLIKSSDMGWHYDRYVENGYLVPLQFVQAPLYSQQDLEQMMEMAKFTLKERRAEGAKVVAAYEKLINTPDGNKRAVSTWLTHARHLKTLIFALGIDHANDVAASFKHYGFEDVGCITSKTPAKERELLLKRFRRGELQILINCMIFIEGVDVPDIQCILNLRPTCSRIIHYQILGRGTRAAEGKSSCLFIDHTCNSISIQPPNEFDDWGLWHKFNPTDYIFTCPSCGDMSKFSPQTLLKEHTGALSRSEAEYVGSLVSFKFRPKTGILLFPCPSCNSQYPFYEAPLTMSDFWKDGKDIEEVILPQEGKTVSVDVNALSPMFRDVLFKSFERMKRYCYKKGWLWYEVLRIAESNPGFRESITEADFQVFYIDVLGYGWGKDYNRQIAWAELKGDFLSDEDKERTLAAIKAKKNATQFGKMMQRRKYGS